MGSVPSVPLSLRSVRSEDENDRKLGGGVAAPFAKAALALLPIEDEEGECDFFLAVLLGATEAVMESKYEE